MIDSMIKEDAKSDWLNLVNKHKKRQKGLPALSKLNTNAGNVELNTNMFNKMNSAGMMSNNPVSGPHGDAVVSTGLAETMMKEENMKREETITLYYPELEVTNVSTGRVFRGNHFEPDEYETTDVIIPYDYDVDKTYIYEFLQDLPELIARYHLEDVSDETFKRFLNTHFDELVEEFNEEICDYFEEDAANHARKNWDESYFEPDWDMMPGGYDDYRIDDSNKETVVDDSFDMSLRTLL